MGKNELFMEEKNWGTSKQLLANTFIEIYRIKVKPKQYCSIHHHKFKYNAFIVIEGLLEIYQYTDKEIIIEQLCAQSSKVVVVDPLIDHCFYNPDNIWATGYEIYWPHAYSSKDDIVRKMIMHPETYGFLLARDVNNG
jgi:mannose-6-phosphate isomerase-like protein (cupin superfamily)